MSEGGQIDFGALARRAQQMQGDMEHVKEDLTAIESTGYGGGGVVTATVSGDGRITSLSIDSSVIDPDDPETLADLVIAAIGEAQRAVTELRSQRIGEVTRGVGDLLAGLRSRGSSDDDIVPRFAERPPGFGRSAGSGEPPQ
jgi:nucleoid-associated protein EbfC